MGNSSKCNAVEAKRIELLKLGNYIIFQRAVESAANKNRILEILIRDALLCKDKKNIFTAHVYKV